MVFQANLRTLEQSWLHYSQWCVTNQVCLGGQENRTSLKDPVDAVPLHGHSHRGQPLNIHSKIAVIVLIYYLLL